MPQLNQLADVANSQFFWLLLVLGVIYFAIGKGMLPKIQSTVDLREKRIAEDVAAAEAAQADAEKVEAEYRARMDASRAEAAKLTGKAKDDGAKSTEKSVGEADAVFTVSDLSSVWVEAPVATKDLGNIRTGMAAQVSASGFDAQAVGTITYISALVGEQTRSATARVVLPNPKGLWRPGLPVRLEVTGAQADVPVAVEVDAIQGLRDWQVVFGRYGQQLEARPLKLGRSDGKHIEVLSGLNAGERYAARNSFVIKAELGKAGASHDH